MSNNVSIGNTPISQWADSELIGWLNDSDGYKLRKKTAVLWVEIFRAFDESGPPMTVRQIFYALVSRGTIPKTEAWYNKTAYHVLKMRRRGYLPYSFVSDSTRWMRKPNSYNSLEDFLRISQDAYRRTLWVNQNAYVEIWCEKDALAGVLFEVTAKWDVPLMVTRGFPSETFVYDAAEAIKGQEKPTYLYYFGDHDPSGKAIPKNTRQKLREFGANFYFEQRAVTQEQITQLGLPTRPTKRGKNRHAKNWEGESVELDAIPVPVLRQMVEQCITQHIDERALKESQRVERLEKETLEHMANNFRLV